MLLNTLEKQAALQPNAIALQGDSRSWSWQQYHDAVKAVAEQLSALKVKRLALEMDNSPEWAIIDLACLISGVVIIPVPSFFSGQQKAGYDHQPLWMHKSVEKSWRIGRNTILYSGDCKSVQ
ncbi:AMP-binding protein [Citrobacter freundii]|uniref:AMP-binding protein n=1 Tax=Citrobacter freundii TaxID=546 RepID=UPI003A87FDF4